MKVNNNNIQGKVVKDNDTYILEDNNLLTNLTLSKTTLKPQQGTRGHSHEDEEEVYFFTKGYGVMQLGEESFSVQQGDVVLIPMGKFHKVMNPNPVESFEFVCVFQKYDRSSDTAKYVKQAEMMKESKFRVDQYNRNRLPQDMIQDVNEISSDDPQDNAPFGD